MSNEIMVREDLASVNLLEQFKDADANVYCSMKDDGTRKSKIKLYNAIQSVDGKIADHINKTLEVVNVIAHPVTLTDEETGEIRTVLRTVLITKEGKTFDAVSGGIANALSRIMGIIGDPSDGSWEKEPVKMLIKQIKTGNGNNKVNTIELVE